MTGPCGAGGSSRGQLVVFSHLRWTWVWQRPQHVMSRLARIRLTWFVEEPVAGDVDEPRLHVETQRAVTRVWLEVPRDETLDGRDAHASVAFDDARAAGYGDAVARLLAPGRAEVVWISTPLALGHAAALHADALVYDVMEDRSAGARAPRRLRARQADALAAADVVFARGPSLHGSIRGRADGKAHLLPSGVEREHFAAARRMRRPHDRPVAGYVGVVDDRLDLDLVVGLADRLPDWTVVIVGPVARIDAAALPRRSNLRYVGMRPYEHLPAVMSGFDVAIMPFALDESTRLISPAKTLEYLAAGLPVVSTAVADVVSEFGGAVEIATGADEFAAACQRVESPLPAEHDFAVGRLLRRRHWDAIADRMEALIVAATRRPLERIDHA